jgi:hypothetical protein
MRPDVCSTYSTIIFFFKKKRQKKLIINECVTSFLKNYYYYFFKKKKKIECENPNIYDIICCVDLLEEDNRRGLLWLGGVVKRGQTAKSIILFIIYL